MTDRRIWRSIAPPSSSLAFATALFLMAFLLSTLCISRIVSDFLFSSLGSPETPRILARRFLERDFKNSSLLRLGSFGELMVSFLSLDLPFTMFVPSESSFGIVSEVFCKTLNMSRISVGSMRGEANLAGTTRSLLSDPLPVSFPDCPQEIESTFALVSRIFGFSAVPKAILSSMVPENDEIELESVSGYRLYLSRLKGGALLVNNLVCETMDITRGNVVIHIVNGVLMDAQLQQSLGLGIDDVPSEADA